MYFRNLMRSGILGAQRYRSAAGADGDQSGGGGGGQENDADAKNDDDKAGDDSGLDDKSAQLLREVMDKKEKLKAERERADTLTQQVAALQKQVEQFSGVDVTKYRELVEKQTKLERERLASEGKFEELEQSLRGEADSRVQQVENEYKTKLTETTTELEQLREQLKNRDHAIRDLAIDSKFGQSKFIREELVPSPAKVHKLYGDHFDVDEKGNMVAYDKPASAANRVKLVDKEGKALGFEDALRRIVDNDSDKDTILRSKVKSGADSKQNFGGDAKQQVGRGLARIQSSLTKQ